MPTPPKDLRQLHSLVQIVAALRSPDGCPWDKEQTHLSLSKYAIEETFELVDAIEFGNDVKIKDELGDVLFQIVLHSQLAQEREAFDIDDVIENLSTKLLRRHPHVFSDLKLSNTQQVIENWEKIKQVEKANDTKTRLDVPVGLPSLQRSFKIGKRTEKYKFDWENVQQVNEKVKEELAELDEALQSSDLKHIEHELGDVLFSLSQLARHLNLEPEQVLRKANNRFEKRFETMFDLSKHDELSFTELSNSEKEKLWTNAKNHCHKSE